MSVLDFLELESAAAVSHLMWVLGTELKGACLVFSHQE